MLDWLTDFGWLLWLVIFLVLAAIEMLSLNLYFILMSVGALAALVAFLLGAEFWLQVVVFAVVALAMTVLVRPVAIAHLRRSPADQRTNVERLIGHDAVVIEAVSSNAGLVKIGGDTWTARIRSTGVVPVGTAVEVAAIDGATAIVTVPAHPPFPGAEPTTI